MNPSVSSAVIVNRAEKLPESARGLFRWSGMARAKFSRARPHRPEKFDIFLDFSDLEIKATRVSLGYVLTRKFRGCRAANSAALFLFWNGSVSGFSSTCHGEHRDTHAAFDERRNGAA